MDLGNRVTSRRLSSSMSLASCEEVGYFVGGSFRERVDDGEEDLKWAALEKLPTYDRLRKGILAIDDGQLKEIDIRSLSMPERRILLERLIRFADEDHERFLLKLKDRIDRVGIDLPTVEVRFEHLSVEAEAYVGSRILPSFFNSTLNTIESFANFFHIIPTKKRRFTILDGVSGIIKPRRMTLLLGPPSSGKTTLLLALAGKLGSDLKVSGSVTYNGHNMDEFIPQRTSSYISQHDLHLREMTVRETLTFSARCQGVGYRYDMLCELSKREKEANIKPDPDIDVFMKATSVEVKETGVHIEYIMKILGLDICADTIIGDQMLRGISGGQKRRVTTGEMIVGPAQGLFMDEISNGLDSSTTFQIINSLRQINHILGGTTLISLLQPAPETFELFDDIILLSDGHIVYQGPREHVHGFFNSIGFSCPKRKAIVDFLQEVTSSKDQHQYWVHHDKPYNYVSAKQFAEAFQSFAVGIEIGNELSIPFDKSKGHPAALTTSKYGVTKMELLKACTERELLLIKRNSFVYAFRALKVLFTALIMMTLFLRTNMHHQTMDDGTIFMGSFFFTIMNIIFNGFSELAMTIISLPVFFKQRDSLFYPSWAYTIPTWILKIPFSVIESFMMVFLSYYVIGYDPSVARFIKQYILLVLVTQAFSGLYRLFAALARTMAIATAITFYTLTMFLVLGGFILAHGDIKKIWVWGYWVSPIMYSQNAISVNEFLGKSWSHIESGSNQTLGIKILMSHGVFMEAKWYWIGVIALLGYVLLFNCLFTIALSYIKTPRKGHLPIFQEIVPKKEIKASKYYQNSSADGINMESHKLKSDLCNGKWMVLPFIPLSVTFDNISYSVDMPQEMKAQCFVEKLVLLNGLSGCFRPGVLTALMGVSGAGKTTLMDVLAGRKTGGYIEGSITISGYCKNQETFARISGYCEQNDIHSPYMTVYESLVYSAWLRLPMEIDHVTKMMFVEEVMELVEMTQLREALVGLHSLNGLSIEQRKRLTIAIELVANPSIIFMDEPTSGVDARSTAIVMRVIRNIVDTGRTMVCTIHQPSIDIFESFDELFLMKRGGEEIYVGPLGHNSCHIINYFEGFNGINKIKDGYNPATWVLEVTTLAQEKLLGVDFSELYKNSNLYQRTRALIAEHNMPPPGSSDLHFATKYSQSFYSQCIACLWKQHSSYWRNSSYTTLRFFFTMALALTFGTTFWNLGERIHKQQDLLNAMGSLYSSVLFMGISYSNWIQPVVAIERPVFYREKAAGMYSAIPYAFGHVAIEIPYIFIQTLLYSIIVYAMIGFEWKAKKFLWYLFFSYFTLLYFTYYGMMTVSMTSNLSIATIVIAGLYTIWNLFGGFIIPRPRMPIWWRWFYWTCPISWSLYGLLVSQYGDVNSMLDTEQTVAMFLRSYFGFKYEFLGVVAFMVVFFTVLFVFLFGMAIKLLNFQKR